MAKYVQLPDKSMFPVAEGEDYSAAMRAAYAKYPEAFGAPAAEPTQKTGLMADVMGAGANLMNIGRTGIAALTGDTTQAAQAGLGRQEELQKKYKSGFEPEKITEKFEKGEYLGAAGEALSQVPSAVAGLLPSMGQEIGLAAAGRLGGGALGALVPVPGAAAVGSQIGQYALPFLVNAIQALGSQAQEKVQTQKEAGEKPDVNALELAPYAAGNAALNLVGTKIAMPSIFKKALGQKVAEETADAAAAAARSALIADARKVAGRGTIETIARGVGGFALGELPTEILQDVVDRAAVGKPLTDDDAFKSYRATALNMVLASPLGGGLGAHERMGARNTAATEDARLEAKAAAEAEAAKNQPDALRQLDTEFRTADQQLQALNAQIGAAKPKKGATEEDKAKYTELKKVRDQFIETTYKPLRQEFQKRKGAIDEMQTAEQSAMEVAGAAGQTAAKLPLPSDIPGAQPFALSDTSRLMHEHDTLRKQVAELEQKLAAGPDLNTQAQLTQQRAGLMARMGEMAPVIEERGGVTDTEQEFTKKVNAAEKERLRLLGIGDFDAAAQQAEKVRALQARAPYLQELTDFRTKAGQTRDLFTEMPEQPEGVGVQYAAYPKGKKVDLAAKPSAPITPFPATAAEAAPVTAVKPEQAAAMQAAQQKTVQAQTALDEAVKTKDTTKIFGAVDALNQAQNTALRAEEDIGRPTLKPAIIDIFSPSNLLNNAIQRGDTKTLNDLAAHSNTVALRTALDKNLSEREILTRLLDTRLDLGGEEKTTETMFAPEGEEQIRTTEAGTGEPLKSIKRERVDLFSQQYDPKQQAAFKNGTNAETIEKPRTELVQEFKLGNDGRPVIGKDGKPVVEREYEKPVLDNKGRPVMKTVRMQDIYDQGGPAAVEYENVMQAVEELSKQVTTKQGNAKQSLYEQLVSLAAQHAELVAQRESGIAAPTLREKVAGAQAALGKGEAPAAREMDAKERHDLNRRIEGIVNKYRLVEGKITPVRDAILKQYGSLYKTTSLEKASKAADRSATEAEERKERTKPLKDIAEKFGMKSPEYKAALEKQVAESKAAGRVPKVAISRAASTAARIGKGNVRKEAETSQKMRDLARDLGLEEAEYQKFADNLTKQYANFKEKYGKNDPQTVNFQRNMVEAMNDKAVELGKKTPEYKATLAEQIKYFQEVLPTAGKQTLGTKRTGQVTRKQSAAPSRLVTSSPESRAESEAESMRLQRRTVQDAREALKSEQEGREEERFLRGVETESVELDSTTVSLLKQNDVRSALTRVGNDSRVDEFSRTIAKLLKTFLDNTDVKLVNKLGDGKGNEILGAATSELIELNIDGGLSVETLLHEGTHAAAERIVQLAENSPELLTREQKLAINELKAIHARIKADPGITSKNAKGSLSEFIAEVMSNRNLQKQLAQRKWRMSDMWNGIKSVIMRMLGVKDVETMFGASAVAIEQLFVPSSVRNLGGKAAPETRVTRILATKDIAALDDGSNSMKQFAAQFGDLIKQKDRTPEDVERIGAQVIDDMLESVWGSPDQSVVAMPTAELLDYKGMTTMSDGKPYDENNPLHYVEATPATFAALEAVNNASLRDREAETIRRQRRDDFKALGLYLQRNYENYTTAETALVLKAAAKYGVISGSNGRLKLAEIGKDNRHNIAVLGKETADAVIEQLREGKGLKQAFLDGLQKNADDNAKNNERKNGWKKFEQVGDTPLLTTLYTDEEVAAAEAKAVGDGLEFGPDAGHNNMDDVIEALVESGYLPFKGDATNNLEKAAIALNEGCAGTPWCTGGSVGTARNQIEGGDFYVYYNKGRPEVAVRMDGDNKIGEVRGNNPNQALDPAQQQIAADFLRAKKFKKADQYLSEFERREALVKLAKGETKLGVDDLLGDKNLLSSDGKVDDYAMGRLLQFRTIDGYGNRPKPVNSVVEFFGKQYLDAATDAYENNEFVFSNISVDETTTPVEVEFAGKKYKALPTEIKAINRLSVNAYSYGPEAAAPVVFPKLARLGSISFFQGELDLPALKAVDEITFFNDTLSRNRAGKIKMPIDARVNEVRGYGEKASGIIEGPQTINLVTLTREGGALTLDLPDTKYVAVADDAESVARHFASEADNAIDDLLKADGLGFADILRAKRGEATPEQNAAYQSVAKKALKKFFKTLEDVFGYAAYEHALNNTDTAEAYRDTHDYRKAIRYAVADVLKLNNNSRESFAKMAKVIKDATGAKVAYPEGQLIAPKRVGNPPYGEALVEAPEVRRFAPKDVGVQDEGKGNYSFKRKPSTSSSVVGREPGIVDKVLGNLMGLAGRVQYFDQYAALEAATKKGLSEGIVSSLEATNINYLLRFGQQRSQFSGQFLTNGPVKAEHTKKAGGVETVYRSAKGTSMVDVATELNKAKLAGDVEQENMFTLYIAGKRANQVGWDKLNFSNPAQAKAEYDAVIARLNTNQTAKDAFAEAAKLYQKYNAGLMDFLVDTGALSAKKAAELKAIEYVPFYRINANGEVQLMIDKERPVRIANIKDQPQLKELIGGNTAILPIFTSAAQNTFMITGMGLRNQAVKETSFMLQKLGIASRVSSGNGPTGDNVVRFFKNGEPYHAVIDTDAYGIPAELVIRGMEGIKTTLPAVIKLMGVPANWLRSFVVRNPAYAVRQVIRDPLNAWLTTGTDAVPVLSSMKELASMVAGRSEAETKLMETGAISSNVYSGDEQDMAKFLKEMSAGKSGWDKAVAKLDTFALQGDAATRAVIYKDSLAKGMTEQEALLRTLESMNFSRRGVSPSMQALSTLIPFFNAQIQGLDVIYRAIKGDMPYSEQLQIREKMIRRGLLLAAGTIAYAAMMEDDEAYKRAKPEERLANWFVYVPGIKEPMRVPIPFEMGFLFKALPEAVWNVAMQDGKASNATSGLIKLAMQTVPLSLPQAIKPLTEAVLGKSFYSGDIESAREKTILAQERYRDSSTELAKTIGAVTGKVGVSPITLDYLIRGYTGGLGIALIQLANPILAPATRAEIAEPTTKTSKMPFIGGLFQPVEGRGTLDEAYDRMEEIKQVKGTYNDMLEKGKRAEATAFAQEYANKLAAASVSGSLQKQLGEVAKQERFIRANPKMTTEQKDAQLERLDKLKVAMARKFMTMTD